MGRRVPELISLLVPTRQRRENFLRLYESAMTTAFKPGMVEIVAYVDNDDDSYDGLNLFNTQFIRGDRVVLSEMWNKCWEHSHGEIYGHCGDDLVFRTDGWDEAIREAINARPGKIAFVWCNDVPGENRGDFGTHGFIHKNWTDITGRFVPPYFVSDYNDTWFNDIAQALDVATYLDNFVTEHMHYSLGKSEVDQNTRDRLDRHDKEDPAALYNSNEKVMERLDEIERLRKFIDGNR